MISTSSCPENQVGLRDGVVWQTLGDSTHGLSWAQGSTIGGVVVLRGSLLAEVGRRLDDRPLVWAGLRGDDVAPLTDLRQLSNSVSILGSYSARPDVRSIAYEQLTGLRVDPEVWDIDKQLHDQATSEFRRELLATLRPGAVLLPYRPSQFLSGIALGRRREVMTLGRLSAAQSPFEYKPWVETALAGLGVPGLPWTYVTNQSDLDRRLDEVGGPAVLRRGRTSGGEGFTLVGANAAALLRWEDTEDGVVALAPYLSGGMPVNVGATVWRDGVTIHHPSVQLIGIQSCVTRKFGYCGNDFGLVRELEPSAIDQVERSTLRIGGWLREHGYLGTFGADFLIHDGVALFTEVNPRFQGSTTASCRLSVDAGEACLLLEHVAAWLGVPCPGSVPLRSRVEETPDLSNVVVHWTGDDRRSVDAGLLVERVQDLGRGAVPDVITPSSVVSDPGSPVARFTVPGRVTRTGFDLNAELDEAITGWRETVLAGGRPSASGKA